MDKFVAWTQAIEKVAEMWNTLNHPWLIGGSCGLLFQGVDVHATPRDLDIYTDLAAGQDLHQQLSAYSVDEPVYSETDKYRSVLSHYSIGGVQVELVTGFQVCVPGAQYSIRVANTMLKYANRIQAGVYTVGLMPLAHELLFNLLRERPDRYEAIAANMRQAPEEHKPVMRELLVSNSFNEIWLNRIAAVLAEDANEFRSR